MRQPHRRPPLLSAMQVSALTLTAIMLAILGCATTGGATPRESAQLQQFKQEYMNTAVARRESGDLETAIEYWVYGLTTYQDALKAPSDPLGAELREAFSKEWPELAQGLDQRIQAALQAKDPYAALRAADLAQHSRAGRPVAPSYEVLAAASEEVNAWYEGALKRIRQARDLRAEAKRAAQDGHHALASCLAASAGDQTMRDQERAKVELPGPGGKPSVAVRLQGAPLSLQGAFEPKLQDMFHVSEQAASKVFIDIKEARDAQIAAKQVTKQVQSGMDFQLSAEAKDPEAEAHLKAMMDRDQKLRAALPCERPDYGQCMSRVSWDRCQRYFKLTGHARAAEFVRDDYSSCNKLERHQDTMNQYWERRDALRRFIRISAPDAFVYRLQPVYQTVTEDRDGRMVVSYRGQLTLRRGEQQVYTESIVFSGGSKVSGEEANHQAGQTLATLVFNRLERHMLAAKVSESELMAGGPQGADAAIRQLLIWSSTGTAWGDHWRDYAADLCGWERSRTPEDASLKKMLGMP